MFKDYLKKLSLGLVISSLLASPVFAQDSGSTTDASNAEKILSVELNGLKPTPEGCRISFLVKNDLGARLTKTSFEMVFFDSEGTVDQLIVLDFSGFREGRMRVRQFNLPDMACDNISQILVNDIPACEADGLNPEACIDNLSTTTRTDVVFGG